MAMDLTDSARTRLEGYLRDVRSGLAGRSDVDAEEVVAGIREHLEADLGAPGRDAPVTRAELDAVLARLGRAEAVAGESVAAEPGAVDEGTTSARARGGVSAAGATAVALGLAGASLVLAGVWPGVGWLALAVGAVLARAVIAGSAPPPVDSPVGALLRAYWTLAAAALVAAVVLLPAVAVWTLAQTGGPLSSPAHAAWGGTSGSYWRWVGAAVGTATGAWWLLLGFALRPVVVGVRRALGPASYLVPRRSPRVLLSLGAPVLVVSVLAWIP